MLHTYLDISDTTRVERALRERAEALEAADKLKTEFVGNMSHELRTPLNAVIGFAEVLSNAYAGDLSDKQRRYVEDILYSAQSLLDLINDILDLAVIDAGQMSLEVVPLNTGELLDGIARMIEPKALQAGIKIVTECPPRTGGFEADERRIKQVLFDLLSNALKFSGTGSTVTLGAFREADHMALWVSDTGAGIAPDTRAQVFEPFSHDGLDGQIGGAGLGLALVKRFVEMHGGHVELSSTPGQGTKVVCRLPLKPE
jgi:signal transduction histidine kinase